MTKQTRSIEAILKAQGPGLSSDICAVLERDGLGAAAARQRVSRVGGSVRKLSGLTFPRSAKFLFLESQAGTRRYWEALIRDINTSSPAYAAALAGMLSRGGVILERHFPIVCGSPYLQKGQMSAATVLQRLKAADVINSTDVAGIGACLTLSEGVFINATDSAALRARLVTEKILLSAVRDWARRLGAASYDKIEIRDDQAELPRVGTFNWDLAGPSYLRPMVRRTSDGKPKPGFLVADVALGENLNEAAVSAFVRKCVLSSSLKNLSPLWPVLIADSFSREAFRLGRSHGVMMATPELLFGEEVAEGLSKLLHTLSKAAAIAVQKPEIVDQLFNSLGKIEGAAGNLRGALFEMLVGHLVVKLDDGTIDIGKKVTDPSTKEAAEIDVFRVKEQREVWSYECKGHQPTQVVSDEAVDKWLKTRIPRIQGWAQQQERFQGCKFYYEYWTCGTFSPEALVKLQEASDRTTRYQIGWKDGPEVRKYAARLRPKAVLQMLDDHFFSHPVARIESRYDAPSETVDLKIPTPLGELSETSAKKKRRSAILH